MIVTTLALIAAAAAPAQGAGGCIPRQAAGDVVVVLLPGIIDRVSDRCSAKAPASAFLKQPAGRQLRDRLAAERPARTRSAAARFRGMAGGEVPPGITDATVVSLMSESMPTGLLSDSYLTAATCADIDQMLSGMASMSADQIGSFFSALLSLSKTRDPAICP